MGLSTSVHEIKTLILSHHPVIAIETVEEERVERLLDAVAEDLSTPVFEWTLTTGLRRRGAAQANRATADPAVLLGHLRGLTVECVVLAKDLARHLEDPALCRAFRDLARDWSRTRSAVVLTAPSLRLPPEVEPDVVHYDLALPGPGELGAVVDAVLESLAPKGGGRRLTPAERETLLSALRGLTLNQARQAVARALLEGDARDAAGVQRILDGKARALAQDGLLEYFPARDNHFELGGFGRLKAWLERARVGFSPEAAALNLSPPRGILLVGVQGCGKSLAAKCIARAWQLPLLKLDAGRLYDKYVGETEKNLRRAIDVAESMAPAVLWIDEIEKAFAAVSSDSGDGGVSRRIFATFLTWMQEKRAPVFVAATANDVFALPPELLRKGRFDELFFVDLPDAEERLAILRIHLAARRQDPAGFDLAPVVAASEGFSGAELEQVVTGALYGALHARQPLEAAALLSEAAATVPLSVSRAEDVARLRTLARERFVPVR
jgi:MoxR-like ATPase